MVAKVRSGKSIRGVLHYNEHKVQSGTGRLILASRFSCDIDQLSFHDKLNRFQKITMLNEKAKTNTLHISLNFDPGEKLNITQIQNIANTYMDKIGFGEQPYLVYNHIDAGHPHMHIATINIQPDGQRIDIHNIGRNQSEQARKDWRQIANAEAIDFYPLLRPFALGLAILLFPAVLSVINGVLKPTVTATASMVKDSNKAINALLKKKEEAIRKSDTWQMYVGQDGSGDRDKWYKYTHPDDPSGSKEGMIQGLGNDVKFAMAKASYNFRNSVKQWMSEVLQVLFTAAALCINTIRTFYLVVLAILGPIVFGFAVFDGFQHTLTVWLARYVNVYMWLPVANIFGSIIGKVLENMLKLDISQVQQAGDTFFSSTDTAYLIFLVIGIVGYFTVPNVANYIVNAGGGNALLQKVNTLVMSGGSSVISAGAAGAGVAADAFGNSRGDVSRSMADNSVTQGYFKDKLAGNS